MINLTKKVLIQALDGGVASTVIVHARKPGLPVVYVNSACEEMTGFDASELIGRSLEDLIVDGDLPEFELGHDGTSFNGAGRITQSWRVKDGDAITVRMHFSPLYDRPGHPSYWLMSRVLEMEAADQNSESEESLRDALDDARLQLKRLERLDQATGIANRRAFTELVQRDWAVARREQRRLAVIIFQIDAFDDYRELFGRHTTDASLRKVAHAITGSLRRSGDFAARYGSDQFAVLVGSADESQALELAERVAQKVRNLSIHHPRSPVARFVTVSYGVASEIPSWTAASTTIFDQAEEQLAQQSQSTEEDSRQAG